jgi:hypothetical protein
MESNSLLSVTHPRTRRAEMIDWFVIGLFVGVIFTGIFSKWCYLHELEYKSKSGIDMCYGGKFYTVKRNLKREKNNNRRSKN